MKAIHYILLLALGLMTAVVFDWREKREAQPAASTAIKQSTQVDTVKKIKPLAAKGVPTVTKLEELRLRIPALFEKPDRRPIFSSLEKLKPEDKSSLIAFYKAQTNLLDRVSMVWALAYIGDEEVFELFKHTLTQEFSGQKITSRSAGENTDEESVLLAHVAAMGLLANRGNLSAYYFLKQGTNPWFWTERALWSSGRGDDTYGLLTSQAITGIGTSGHKEVPAVLEDLKKGQLLNPVGGVHPNKRNLAGAIADAGFNYHLTEKLEFSELVRLKLTPEIMENAWEEWQKTEKGQEWWNWYQQAVNLPMDTSTNRAVKVVH